MAKFLRYVGITVLIMLLFSGCRLRFWEKSEPTTTTTQTQTQPQEADASHTLSITKPSVGSEHDRVLAVEAVADPKPDKVTFIFQDIEHTDESEPYSHEFDIREYPSGEYTLTAVAHWGGKSRRSNIRVKVKHQECDPDDPVIIGGRAIPNRLVSRSDGGCVESIRLIYPMPPSKGFLNGIEKYSNTLRELVIAGNSFTDIDLSLLSACRNLEVLTLEVRDVISLDLSALRGCIALRKLSIIGTSAPSFDLLPLSNHQNLEAIVIHDNRALARLSLDPLATCPNLMEVIITDNDLPELDLNPLRYCTNLRRLDISGNSIQSLPLLALGRCTKLEYLSVSRNQLKSVDLEPLSNCEELRQLHLSNNSLVRLDLSVLTRLVGLSVIKASYNELETVRLPGGPNIREINLYSNRLTNIDLTPLATSIALEWVILDRNELSGIDLTPLVSSTNLVSLWLSYNNLLSIDFTPLENAIKLEQLDLFHNRLTRVDLTPLVNCANLWRLDLGSNQIDEIELSPLSGISSLSELYLENNPFSTSSCDAIYRFSKAHSYCHVEFDCGYYREDLSDLPAITDGEPVERFDDRMLDSGNIGEERRRPRTKPIQTMEIEAPGQSTEIDKRRITRGNRL